MIPFGYKVAAQHKIRIAANTQHTGATAMQMADAFGSRRVVGAVIVSKCIVRIRLPLDDAHRSPNLAHLAGLVSIEAWIAYISEKAGRPIHDVAG